MQHAGYIRLLAALCTSVLVTGLALAEPTLVRQQELQHLLHDDCGACHGMTLKGGLGLPLTADALRDKPDDLLITTILDGRAGTPMPPWRRFLSADEARWLVVQLKRGMP